MTESNLEVVNRFSTSVTRIGIGITTRNRNEVFEHTYSQILKFAPKNAKIVVVDDASKIPVEQATYRFESNVGIARAKNKCFELLEDCEYIFLFDDDIYPIKVDWHIPYIESGHNHAMMIFDKLHDGRQNGNRILLNYPKFKVYANPCGCMLFYTRKCIEAVGGMDVEYGIWGHEHVDLSVRIFNSGLTKYKFIDIPNSLEYFYSHDYFQTVERSVPSKIRAEHIKRNGKKFLSLGKSSHFIPYKELSGRIITTYFTGCKDPQRGTNWDCSPHEIQPLIDSVLEKSNTKITIISDCLSPGYFGERVDIINDDCLFNPYLQRWFSILDYLKTIHEEYVFCVDATDVEMLNNPFIHYLGDRLYVGDEPSTIKNDWLIKHHDTQLFKSFYKTHAHKPLLNAGIVGGKRELVLSFLDSLKSYATTNLVGHTDMALFNFLIHTKFYDKVTHGRKVNTIFKTFSTEGNSWFRHK